MRWVHFMWQALHHPFSSSFLSWPQTAKLLTASCQIHITNYLRSTSKENNKKWTLKVLFTMHHSMYISIVK
jgi:hypothetical protein